MYETKILKYFTKVPVFSLSDINQIISNKDYAKKFLKRLVKNKTIYKIKKNTYTFHNDPLLITNYLLRPSYISSVSALSYYKLITQIPNEIFCATSKISKKIKFITPINYFHTNYFFGFQTKNYENFKILIADPEKAIIDSFSIVPVSIFEEAFEAINTERMLFYLKKIKRSDIIKRIGYLIEKNNHSVYKELKKFINYKYITLDPIGSKYGKKDKKWRLIINIK